MAFEKVQIQYDGQLRDFNLVDLDLANPEDPTDAEVREAVRLAVEADDLNNFEVVRGETVINLKPHNTWGHGG